MDILPSCKSNALLQDLKLCRLEPGKAELENSGFDRMSEEEVLAAVLEISRREASPVLSPEDDDKPTSSPDTGSAEDDIPEMPENPDAMEIEKSKTITEPGKVHQDKYLLHKTCVPEPLLTCSF